MAKTEIELLELLSKITPGPWELSKNDKGEWCIWSQAAERFVMKNIPKCSNYDLRALSLLPELLTEVITARVKARKE